MCKNGDAAVFKKQPEGLRNFARSDNVISREVDLHWYFIFSSDASVMTRTPG